jgi:hypothetical protein
MGTGGNRFGPLGAHGLGDKAKRWGRVFDRARVAAGDSATIALNAQGSLMQWDSGAGPRELRVR